MKGKGGPENKKCSFKGVRQQTWGKWVGEIQEPNGGKRLWLGTFGSAVEVALAYDEAARAMYGPDARINLPNDDVPSSPDRSMGIRHTKAYTLRGRSSTKLEQRSPGMNSTFTPTYFTLLYATNPILTLTLEILTSFSVVKGESDSAVAQNKGQSINEAGSSGHPMYDAWSENKVDDFDFDFLDTEFEECNVTLEDFGLSLDPVEPVM
uniref:Dehydration-responsive element-binding protein 2A-like n=1 Tax=Tanacetum cinerariifolium TaxID=118510 RepID=A0A6L2KTC4_TANCI|nr:dehydration-responsive element-binding protein 2A-like [Tanacetum cinerariifolium]